MAEKTRIIEINEKAGGFTSVFRKFKGSKKDYNTKDLSLLRQLLSNEKARILNVIKIQKPTSIYALAKFLKRDFKTVRDDILLLKKFGFVDFIEEKKGNRISHKPILTANEVNIVIRV
jgi:predicted transcriptional regulator